MSEGNKDAQNGNPQAESGHIAKKLRSRRTIIKHDRRQLNETKQELEQARKNAEEAGIDVLTNLPARRIFLSNLHEEARRVSRERQSGKTYDSYVLILDANNLKLINDNPDPENGGHKAGDAYLRKIADTLKTALEEMRPGDSAARYGGDEFAMIFSGIDKAALLKVYDERLLPLLKKNRISIAIGASRIDPEYIQKSIDNADKAMYEAKAISKKGIQKNQFVTESAFVINTSI